MVAEFVKRLLPKRLRLHISQTPSDLHSAIEKGFLAVDTALYDEEFRRRCGVRGGAAVAAAVLWRGRCMVAHCGDSRAAIVNLPSDFVPLTFDHTPKAPDEHGRILHAGGRIANGRVLCDNGSLAMTRCIGDHHFAGVIASPDVFEATAMIGGRSALLLATDGLWDVMGAGGVMAEFSPATPWQGVCTALCEKARLHWQSQERRCDDVSVMLVGPRLRPS